MSRDDGDMREVAVLFRVVEAVADDETILDGKPTY
jgi:hypothetical protein